jgi:hypothetical protein
LGVVLLLRKRKKGYFAEESQTLLENDEEVGLSNSAPSLLPSAESYSSKFDPSLLIRKKDIQMEGKIAAGSFGDVFRGKYQGQTVAVKQLKSQLSDEAEEALFGEVNIMATLHSPCVMTSFPAKIVTRSGPATQCLGPVKFPVVVLLPR